MESERSLGRKARRRLDLRLSSTVLLKREIQMRRWRDSDEISQTVRRDSRNCLFTHFTSSAMVVVMSLRPSRSSAISFRRLDTLFITSSRVFLSSTCCSGDKPLTAALKAAVSTEQINTDRATCPLMWFAFVC